MAAPDKWFNLELIVEGPKIRVLMNGESQIEYTDPDWKQPDIWESLQITCSRADPDKATTSTLTIKRIELKELRPFVRFAHGEAITGWGQVVDPTGTCHVFRAADELAIYVPAGQYQMTTKNMDAPRVLRDVKGDFTAQVAVLPFYTEGEERFDAGLVVWKDSDHFVRFVRGRNNEVVGRHVLSVDVYHEGKLKTHKDIDIGDKYLLPIWLSVEKRDGRLRFTYSTDGDEWHDGPIAADEPWPGELKVGVSASNTRRLSEFGAAPPGMNWSLFRDLQIKEPEPACRAATLRSPNTRFHQILHQSLKSPSLFVREFFLLDRRRREVIVFGNGYTIKDCARGTLNYVDLVHSRWGWLEDKVCTSLVPGDWG